MLLRMATKKDEAYMYALKNDPITRLYALATDKEIPAFIHAAFWADHYTEFLMIYLDDPDAPIGAVRTKRDGEVAIWIDAKHRGHGIGPFILEKVGKAGVTWAKIAIANVSSMRAFIKAGFAPWKLETIFMRTPDPNRSEKRYHYIFKL